MVDDGEPTVIVGGVLSTVKVVLGPAAEARFPEVSLAVPAAIEIPKLPLPVMLVRVTCNGYCQCRSQPPKHWRFQFC